MSKESTSIKNLINDAIKDFMLNHPEQNLCKWQYVATEFANGIENKISITLTLPMSFEKYGQAQVFHPRFGSWVANLTGGGFLNVATPRQ